ncbi:transcriptional repressor [Candidatus Pacearchaeota archaeon]|nr:transcriptional repressor [Candidatus Pacearchaeota archaeon]
MNSQSNRMEFLRQKCKEHKLKITPQRTAIYLELIDKRSHPSADDIYREIKNKYSNISFDTVNRTLLSFAEIGIIKITENYGRQKRFDTAIENHHHLCCIKCNRIIDFKNDQYDDLKIPSSISKKYTVLGKKVVLEGICDKCIKKSK